jgi:hypothetical protein
MIVRAHLTQETYRRLLEGALSPSEARALAEHLASDCPCCEELLEAGGRAGADPLDGRIDRALAGLTAARVADAGNDLEFERIQRRLAGEARHGEPEAARPRHRRAWGAAAAAALVLVASAGALEWARAPRSGSASASWTGEKGRARAVPVRLRFLVLDPAGGIEKGVEGEAVRAGARLQFEIELGSAADVALVRVPAAGAPEVFLRERLGSGLTTVSVGGRPAAYPLEGLAGAQRFVAIASPDTLDERGIDAAAQALAPPARPDAAALLGLSLDAVEVEVAGP